MGDKAESSTDDLYLARTPNSRARLHRGEDAALKTGNAKCERV
jgi:hypothetical protein